MIMYLIHSQKLHSFYLCIFLAVLGLRYFAQAFSSCGKQGLLFVVVCEPLIITVTSLVAEHRLQAHRRHLLWHRGSVVGTRGPQCVQTCRVVPYSLSSCGFAHQSVDSEAHRLFAPQHVESSQTRDPTCVPCGGRQIPTHCTTRAVLH